MLPSLLKHKLVINLAIFLIYFFVIFLALEISLRFYFNKPLLKFVDFRISNYILVEK